MFQVAVYVLPYKLEYEHIHLNDYEYHSCDILLIHNMIPSLKFIYNCTLALRTKSQSITTSHLNKEI